MTASEIMINQMMYILDMDVTSSMQIRRTGEERGKLWMVSHSALFGYGDYFPDALEDLYIKTCERAGHTARYVRKKLSGGTDGDYSR